MNNQNSTRLYGKENRQGCLILNCESFSDYIEKFNSNDNEQAVNSIGNKEAWEWLKFNIPFFEASDRELEEAYYLRWWTFRKYIKNTTDGFVITEALSDISREKENTSCRAADRHFYEGRWLRDRMYLRDYAGFLLHRGGSPLKHAFGAADSLRAWSMVTQDQKLPAYDLLSNLIENFLEWEKSNKDENGLFWQSSNGDEKDRQACCRTYDPSINSCMYGEAIALRDISQWAFESEKSFEFAMKAAELRELTGRGLWDETMGFFKALPCVGQEQKEIIQYYKKQAWIDAYEPAGFIPWYYNLPQPGHEIAWKRLLDTEGFFESCDSDAAFRTLTALANLLNNYKQYYINSNDYLELLKRYMRSKVLRPAYNTPERSMDVGLGRENDSAFIDLIITGLVGLRPRMDQKLEINPLAAEDAMEYFCLDGIRYHNCNLTILWDSTGKRYNKGKGLRVFADGEEIASSQGLSYILAKLPQSSAGWEKIKDNPVIGGGSLGTVFDVDVRLEDGKYRMWGSWRDKGSLALFESTDGVHWSEPEIVLAINPDTGWEGDISRPTILKREDGYHLWYTGMGSLPGYEGCWSYIGYATSLDGIKWKRMCDSPVLAPELKWEGPAVMNPSVLWDEDEKLYKMWYSAGFKGWEPNEIGYATSSDGLNWKKHPQSILVPDPESIWEQEKVTGCQVFRREGWYYIAYIGLRDTQHAQIGMARSRDGITHWERHPRNPIIRAGQDEFDQDACYKPCLLFNGREWMLWYNGRHGILERIALAVHEKEDLGF